MLLWKIKYTFSKPHQEKGAQINKIRNAKGEVTTNVTEIQRLIKDYQPYANKMDNLEEINNSYMKLTIPRNGQSPDSTRKKITIKKQKIWTDKLSVIKLNW